MYFIINDKVGPPAGASRLHWKKLKNKKGEWQKMMGYSKTDVSYYIDLVSSLSLLRLKWAFSVLLALAAYKSVRGTFSVFPG